MNTYDPKKVEILFDGIPLKGELKVERVKYADLPGPDGMVRIAYHTDRWKDGEPNTIELLFAGSVVAEVPLTQEGADRVKAAQRTLTVIR